MLYEVFALHLKFNGPPKVMLDLLEVIGSRMKTKLATGKLVKKMKEVVECSATRFSNGLCLISSEHIKIEACIDGDHEEDNVEREYRMQERAMNCIVVSAESVPDQEVDDDSDPVDFGTIKGGT